MRARVRRRAFIGLLGGAMAGWSLDTSAQQPAMPVVGFLSSGSRELDASRLTAFRQGRRPARLRGPMEQLTTRPNRPCGAAARRQLIQHLVGGAEEVPLTRLNAFPLEARCFHIAMSRNATKPVGTSPEKVGHPSPQLMWREDSLAGTQRSVPACAPGRPANATIVLDQGSATSVSTPSATFP